ncbi:MAG: hypothetical protein R3F20_13750 [Planctomycetota bacterium]
MRIAGLVDLDDLVAAWRGRRSRDTGDLNGRIVLFSGSSKWLANRKSGLEHGVHATYSIPECKEDFLPEFRGAREAVVRGAL